MVAKVGLYERIMGLTSTSLEFLFLFNERGSSGGKPTDGATPSGPAG